MQTQPLKLDWPALMFHAVSSNEEMREVRIVTACSEYVDMLNVIASDNTINYDLTQEVTQLIEQRSYYVREYVRVDTSGIQICINADVIDDNTTTTALDMLASSLDALSGSCGTIYYGDALAFDMQEIKRLVLH